MSLQDLISAYTSRKELCRAIGCSRQFLSQIENGKRPFPIRLALKVERMTNGRFPASSFCPDLFEPGDEKLGSEREKESFPDRPSLSEKDGTAKKAREINDFEVTEESARVGL